MRNRVNSLINSYYECLHGNLSLEVFKGAVPGGHKGDYVWIRAESESDASNRERFVTNPVVIIEIITFNNQDVNTATVEGYDDEIRQLIFPTRKTTGLPDQDDMQILNVRMTDAFYNTEFDGVRYRHRKICRYTNRITQLLNVTS